MAELHKVVEDLKTEKRGPLNVIKEYFKMTTGDMRVEYRDLSDTDRLELARGAAKELGLKDEEVAFSLD